MSNNEKLISYEGDEPYIFISYSHKDEKEVEDVLIDLQNEKFRFWYDKGIALTCEWDENIAEHIQKCDCFFAFLSKNYMSSDNCIDELKYSRDINKKQLLINLDNVKLQGAIGLRMSRTQAIYKSKLENGERIIDRVLKIEDIEKCKNINLDTEPDKDKNFSKVETKKIKNEEFIFKDLKGADLSNKDFNHRFLEHRNLCNANLRHTNLRYAKLSYADLRNAYLRDADLSGTDLRNAYLNDAVLDGANFDGANIYGCQASKKQKKYMLEHGAVEIAPKE